MHYVEQTVELEASVAAPPSPVPALHEDPIQLHTQNYQVEQLTENPTEPHINQRRSERGRQPPIWMKGFVSLNIHEDTPYAISKYIAYDKLNSQYQAYIAKTSTVTEPKAYSEALKDPRWVDAMKDEIEALPKNHTWEITSLPAGKILKGCKWIYKVKHKSTGEIKRFKARLVAKDNSMHQRKDTLELISELGLSTTKPVSSPMDINVKLTTKEYDDHLAKIGTDIAVHPPTDQNADILYDAQTLSQNLHQPKKSFMDAAIRIVKYVKKEPGKGIILSKNKSEGITAYCDAE
ncbi:uncharacterized protein LOC142164075 [Nicotiana tabacum]|uniref:Uncharacterized protein LOC142164075 n=1 Tax=Nicotiana tabacum TaxID=4097 RepID=A0AC58RXB0_TOBAC